MNKIEAFLSRIGLSGEVRHTPDFLEALQYACVTTIPYENLDILDGKPILLDADTLFEKIVTNRRGGYCFEVNALLHHMLAQMGFAVECLLARYLRGESAIPFRRHRVLTVTCGDDVFFLDIGVGQVAPRHPLKLVEGEVQEQFGETYRFTRDTELGWILWDLHDGAWRRYVSFTDERQYEIDFVPPSFWSEKHPDSPFNKAPMLAIKTRDGRKTIDDHTFKEFAAERLSRIEENVSDGRLLAIFREEFGIER